jgi:ABC-type dipeptide/oligopeptide/nickel transport system permease component
LLGYLIRRLAWIVPVLVTATLLTFILMHAAPGSPWNRPPEAPPLPPEVEQRLNERFGLDQPLHVQYLRWLAALAQGDFGQAYRDPAIGIPAPDVTELLAPAIGPSLHLGAMAFGLALVAGIGLGSLAGLRKGSWIDALATGTAMLGMAAPAFLIAILLQLLLGQRWTGEPGLFPVRGWESPEHWVLPTVALAGLPAAQIARFTRASIIEVRDQDYIRTAYSKGLTDGQVLSVHMLRNALIPVVTILGPMLAVLITGSIVVETVFEIPGLGSVYIDSIHRRDYGVMMAMTVVYAAAIALLNLVVDVSYAFIDPRLRAG